MKALVTAADRLRRALAPLTFPEPVSHTYNPLTYAWEAHCEYLGYEPTIDRYDVTNMISEIRRQTGISYEKLATKIGVCADTLVNLKSGRYQPTRRTYQRLKAFATSLTT